MKLLYAVYAWLPDHVDRRLKVIGWFSLVGQLVLIASGGAVRLTGSGLGCPTWPRCTPDSLVTTPAMGIHGIIEFTNRTLTFALIAIAIVAFVLTLRVRRERSDLFWITFAIGMSIPAQGILGGFTVLSDLNPYVVGLHFVVSIVLVGLAAAFLVRIHAAPGPRMLAVPRWYALAAYLTGVFAAVTILLGIVTTGSGPHAGDANAPRTGLSPELVQHLHSLPAYGLFALTAVLVTGAFTLQLGPGVRRFSAWLLVLEFAQIGIGLLQANTGLPGILVGTHMVLAGLIAAAVTTLVLALRRPLPAPVAGDAAERVETRRG